MINPKDIIGKDEEIVEVMRRHWVSIVPLMSAWAVVGLLALYGFYLVGRYSDQITTPLAAVLGLTAMIVLALICAYITYRIYRQNIVIITNSSAYLVSQTTLFSKQIDQFGLHRLQEATAMQNGIFATILDYGDVIAETAGDEKNMNFKWARHPKETAERIMDYHAKFAPKPGSTQD